jgi:glycine cleavage system H protein
MADQTYPQDLQYSKEHDWVRVEGENAVFGISWFAQDSLGEIVFADLPAVGSVVSADQPYGELESVKAVSDLVAPLSGEVTAVNTTLLERPQNINEDCYGAGWLIAVHMTAVGELGGLMDVASYTSFLDEA